MEAEANNDIVKVDEEGVEEEEFIGEVNAEAEVPEDEEDEEEEEEEEEEEGEGEDEIKPVKKRRCQRRKKIRRACFDEEGELEEEELQFEEEEEEEEEEDEEEESDIFSYGSSVLSAITFEWEDEVYEFEELCDPGNIETVYQREYKGPEEFDELGVVRYYQICQALAIIPMVRVIRSLGAEEIDLSHRNIDSKSIRAMCAALESNNKVHRFILKFNKLVKDDCWYIGRMLKTNEAISLIDFTGCGIGPEGLDLLVEHLPNNEVLVELNLSKCNLRDEGMKILGYVLTRNNSIEKLDLSYNKLGDEAAEALAGAFKLNTSITHLNLRYNNLFNPSAMKAFFRALTAFNNTLTHLNLTWNGLSGEEMGNLIGNFLKKNQTIQFLDLSDNRLANLAVIEIKKGLAKSTSLEVLKIGKNPMLSVDTEALLSGAKGCTSLQVLDLEDLWVSANFIKTMGKILKTRELKVIYSGIYSNYEVHGPDYPKVILERAQFEAMKPKSVRKRKDFGHLMWTLGEEPLTEEEFMFKVKKFKAKINKELYPELIKQFQNPRTMLIDVVAMKKKYLSLFPDSTPPPPPKPKKGEVLPTEVPEEPKKEEEVSSAPAKEDAGELEDEEGELYIEGFEDEEGELYIEGFVDEEEEEPEEEEEEQEEEGEAYILESEP